MSLAPIALFAYNRPSHTGRVVESLLRNPEAAASELFVFSDGARNEPESIASVQAVRRQLKTIDGFKSVEIAERERNFGLADSIIDGVTRLCASHGRAIVVEDDIEVSPFFLRYMNEALELYRNDARIISISGYTFPVKEALPASFFLRMPECWGWATWKRGWDLFDPDAAALHAEIRRRGLEREFDLDGSYGYTRMLESQAGRKVNSWAIRWYASAFLLGGLTLYSGRSLARNIGMDGSGVHNPSTDSYDTDFADRPIELQIIPVREDERARACIASFLKKTSRSWRNRLPAWIFGR